MTHYTFRMTQIVCRGWESNPHVPFGTTDFKSVVSRQLHHPGMRMINARRRSESNRCIRVLQTLALPLGYAAIHRLPAPLGMPSEVVPRLARLARDDTERACTLATRNASRGVEAQTLALPLSADHVAIHGRIRRRRRLRRQTLWESSLTRGHYSAGLKLAARLEGNLATHTQDIDAIRVVVVFVLGDRVGRTAGRGNPGAILVVACRRG